MTLYAFEVIFNHGDLQQLLFLPEKPQKIIFKYSLEEIVLRIKNGDNGLFEIDSENSSYSAFENEPKIAATAAFQEDVNTELERFTDSNIITCDASEISSKSYTSQNQQPSHPTSTVVCTLLNNKVTQCLTLSQNDVQLPNGHQNPKSDAGIPNNLSDSIGIGVDVLLSKKHKSDSYTSPAKHIKIAKPTDFLVEHELQNGSNVESVISPEYFVVEDQNVTNSGIQDNTVVVNEPSELSSQPVSVSPLINPNFLSDSSLLQKTLLQDAPTAVGSNSSSDTLGGDKNSASVPSHQEISKTVDQVKVEACSYPSDDSLSVPGNEGDFDYDSGESDDPSNGNSKENGEIDWRKKCAICLKGKTPLRFLHRFPKDPACSYKWAEISGKAFIKTALCRERTSTYRICSDHFQATDYDQENCCLLSKALPSVFLSSSQKDIIKSANEASDFFDGEEWPNIDLAEDEVELNLKPKMFKCSLCFRPKTSHRVMHRFPRDPVLSEKWAQACDRNWITRATPEERVAKFRICMEHFRPSEHSPNLRLFPNAIPSRIPPKPKPIVLRKTDDEIILSNGVIYQKSKQSTDDDKSFLPEGLDKGFTLNLKEKLRAALHKNSNNETTNQTPQDSTVFQPPSESSQPHSSISRVNVITPVTKDSNVHSLT